ncbi:PDR/VanB family oxidoreductase [Rhodococcus sp. NPDC003318]|uniref:PDR/VanB family oxidoreductase n=1 Tax=Rhodococcus sp. NPDC003318 TaxID=3364503 RepID=UPI0036B72B71
MDLELSVVRRRAVADQIVELTLAPAGGGALPEWEPGAHIDLELGDLVRQYSLTGLDHVADRWTVSILREQDGRGGSCYVHDRIVQGSAVRVSAPRNHFALTAGSNSVLFVAGGIGITPILPMITQLESDGREWNLFYCGRSRQSMAYRDELARFGERVTFWADDERGVPDLATLVAKTDTETVVYACGPGGLLTALETVCASKENERILRLEHFVPKESAAEGPSHEFEVEFAQSGVTATVPADRSILAVAEELGVDILSSCAEGTCGTCETPVLAGTPDHRDSVLTDEERAGCATIMPCVSRALSARLTLDA